MYYYNVNRDGLIVKNIVIIDNDKLNNVRNDIIYNCSLIEHYKYRSSSSPDEVYKSNMFNFSYKEIKIGNSRYSTTKYLYEYDEYIFKRFSQFEIVTNKEINNYLRFNETSVEININGDYKILKNRIVKTDIYPIINNVIAYIINDKSNMFVHSLVVSKGNNGILIIGEFGQGKSTFAKEFVNNGYEINSTDQTWLKFKENDLYQELGSSFDIENGKIKTLETKQYKKEIKINKIIRIVGLCNEGKTQIDINNNKYYIVKNIAPFCYWSYMMPLFTDDVELYNTNTFVKSFLNKIDESKIFNFEVRGDKREIIKKLEEI